MKLAIIGSRTLSVENMGQFVPANTTEIVSGGARGIDRQAAVYAKENHIALTEFLPDYARYGKGATFRRNRQIAEYAETALIFWDGSSKGTQYMISLFERFGKKVTIIKMGKNSICD